MKSLVCEMKLKMLLPIIGFIFLISCRQTIVKKVESETLTEYKEVSFGDYLKLIPEIKLPLGLKCEVEIEGSTFYFTRETIDKYGQENSRIHGKIAETNNYTAIIYLYPADIVLPIIVTTDKNGNKISELKMYEKWCGEEEFSWGTSWANISKDLVITLSDSAIIFKRNEEVEIIEESKKTEVRHRKFQIDSNGQIIRTTNE